jgi:hypothetical protein
VRSPGIFTPTSNNPRGSFSDYYEGGWQELFPVIGEVATYEGAPMGIHGEVCLNPWEYEIIEDCPKEISVKFHVRTVRTPYVLEKVFTMKTEDPAIYIDETLRNEGCNDMNFMWGHHPAFGPIFLDGNCVIEMPGNCKARTNNADLGRYAVLPPDTDFMWPKIRGIDGVMWDVSKVPSPHQRIFQIFHLYNISEGWYAVSNTMKQTGFSLKWDKNIFPYIWVWAPYGGCESLFYVFLKQ